MANTSDNIDLESLVHLEQTFYDAGYTDGVAHGRIHGLLQGRTLGLHHGYSLWEEIAFYEGFARTWDALARGRRHRDEAPEPKPESSSSPSPNAMAHRPSRQQDQLQLGRAAHHITHLLDLVRQFPTVNPSASSPNASSKPLNDNTSDADADAETETDLASLQRQIRSRYKALCASLGLRPSLRAGASPGHDADVDVDDGEEVGVGRAANGSSSTGARRDVWTLEGDVRRPTMQGLSF